MSIESGGKSNEWISREDWIDCDVEGAFDIDSITYVPLFSDLNMWLNYNLEIYRWSRSWSVSVVLLTSWFGTRTCKTSDMQQHGVFSIPMSDGFLPDPLMANWIWFKQITLIAIQVCTVLDSTYTHSCFLVVRVQHQYYRPSCLFFHSASAKLVQISLLSFSGFVFRQWWAPFGEMPSVDLSGEDWLPVFAVCSNSELPYPRNVRHVFQSGTALSSWIRMDFVIIGDVWLRLEIDLLIGRVCSPTQTKIHQEEIWFVLCPCSHK